jgi:hypothetical protein
VTRPWRRLTSAWWLLAPLVALGALVVLVATSGGRAAAVAAGCYALAAATLLVVASYACRPRRRALVAGLVAVGGVAQFWAALVPWWGGGDPASPMVGTYYWHNQLAAALLAPALVGLGVLLGGGRPWRWIGWLAVPLSVAGVVLSTSRAAVALLAVGWVAVCVVALVHGPHRRRLAVRMGAASLVAVVVTLALPGPPLFSARSSPVAGAAARAAGGETLAANGTYRAQFWAEAFVAARHDPVTGVGFGRVGAVVAPEVPDDWAVSALVHDGPLQALADGGLVLGLPVLLGTAALAVALGRRLAWRAGPPADVVLVRAGAVAGLVLVAHALVDTDWSYPGLAVELAVVAGLALAAGRSRVTRAGGPTAGAAACGLLGAVLVVVAAMAWGQAFHVNAPDTLVSGAHQSSGGDTR